MTEYTSARRREASLAGWTHRTRPAPPSPAEDRLWLRVEEQGDCWVYTGPLVRGYGHIRDRGRTRRIHRVAYEWACGPIPDGLDVLHHCDNPPCIRPSHLFLGTAKDNVADMFAKSRQRHPTRPTHCHAGHEFTPENTYSHRGKRYCRACARVRNAARRAPR